MRFAFAHLPLRGALVPLLACAVGCNAARSPGRSIAELRPNATANGRSSAPNREGPAPHAPPGITRLLAAKAPPAEALPASRAATGGAIRLVEAVNNSGLQPEGDTPTSLSSESAITQAQAHEPEAVAADNSADWNSVQRVDLAGIFELVDGQNPQVRFAREQIEEALARLDRAKVLWLPSIRAGVNWNRHEGRIQDVAGTVFDTSRGSYFAGAGAEAVGAGSPRIQGLLATFHLADAYFEPRAAERAADARTFRSQAVTNDMLLEASLAYLALLAAHQELAIARETLDNARLLAGLTAAYAQTGQGLPADDDRARAELAIRENDLARGGEAIRVAQARLAEKLNLDATARIEPREPVVVAIELQKAPTPLSELVSQALLHRPEISEHRCLAGEAVQRLKREQFAPLVPSVLLGLSYGGLAGGIGTNFSDMGDRLDADLVAWWEIRNLGLGERATRNEAMSRVEQARWREVMALDRVAREVVEAHAQVEARRGQIAVAQSGILAARSSFERNLERIRNAQGIPLETLQSIQALAQAQREYLRVVISHNEAQLRLQRALGWPAREA